MTRRAGPPSPLQSGDLDTEIQRALSAWTAPPSASITLQYFGPIKSSDPNPAHEGDGNGTVLISFEDPNGEIDNPGLALGGGFATFSNGGVVGGQTFNRSRAVRVLSECGRPAGLIPTAPELQPCARARGWPHHRAGPHSRIIRRSCTPAVV